MILQNFTSQFDLIGFYPIMTFFGLIFFFVLMVYCYLKLRIFWLILIIYLFSLIIGVLAVSESIIPFTPYLQIFFLIFQSILFIETIIGVFQDKNKGF